MTPSHTFHGLETNNTMSSRDGNRSDKRQENHQFDKIQEVVASRMNDIVCLNNDGVFINVHVIYSRM